MGREVRRVPANWIHPRYELGHPDLIEHGYLLGRYISKFEGSYDEALAEWNAEKLMFEAGLQRDYGKPDPTATEPLSDSAEGYTFEDWHGEAPKPEQYMPNWPDEERTHYMMYETTSEGSPISPAFETPEELAHWLADNNASAFGGQGASYESWLSVARGGWAPSAVAMGGELMSGVEGIHRMEQEKEAS